MSFRPSYRQQPDTITQYSPADDLGNPVGDKNAPLLIFKAWPDLPDSPHSVSSSGRQYGTSPAERQAYLASISGRYWEPLAPGAGLLERIAEAERLVELCLEDLEEATGAWRNARSDSPELAEFRALDPGQRHSWDQRMRIETKHEDALARYEQARDTLLRLLDDHERAAQPIDSRSLSDPYGPDRDGLGRTSEGPRTWPSPWSRRRLQPPSGSAP